MVAVAHDCSHPAQSTEDDVLALPHNRWACARGGLRPIL